MRDVGDLREFMLLLLIWIWVRSWGEGILMVKFLFGNGNFFIIVVLVVVVIVVVEECGELLLDDGDMLLVFGMLVSVFKEIDW